MKQISRKEIERKVKEILTDELQISDRSLKATDRLKGDLGADSIDAVDITLRLEREFTIIISEQQMEALTDCTVSDLCDIVQQLRSEAE